MRQEPAWRGAGGNPSTPLRASRRIAAAPPAAPEASGSCHPAVHAQISLAKLNNVREAMNIARMARDILGGRGILSDHHVIRHLCDLEAVSTLEGTESMHTLIIGQELTGIPAFF